MFKVAPFSFFGARSMGMKLTRGARVTANTLNKRDCKVEDVKVKDVCKVEDFKDCTETVK